MTNFGEFPLKLLPLWSKADYCSMINGSANVAWYFIFTCEGTAV